MKAMAVIVGLMVVVLTACDSGMQPRRFSVLGSGANGYAPDLVSPPDQARHGVRVVTDAHDYVRLWRLNMGDSAAVPPVDFERQCVLVAQAGTRPEGAFAVRIAKIEQEDVSLVVHVVETGPCPAEATGMTPFAMVAVDRPCQPIETEWVRTGTCE